MYWIPENSHCESVRGGVGGRVVVFHWGGTQCTQFRQKQIQNFPFKMKVKSFVYPRLVRPLSGIVVVKLQTNDLK